MLKLRLFPESADEMHVVEERASTLCVHEFTVLILACSYRITCFIFFNFRSSQMQILVRAEQINSHYARYAFILLSFKVHGNSNKTTDIKTRDQIPCAPFELQMTTPIGGHRAVLYSCHPLTPVSEAPC